MRNTEEGLRQKLMAAARQLGEGAHYRSAGTVEFLVEQETASFYFLEVNTRLQVQIWLHLCSSEMARQLPVSQRQWHGEAPCVQKGVLQVFPGSAHATKQMYHVCSLGQGFCQALSKVYCWNPPKGEMQATM